MLRHVRRLIGFVHRHVAPLHFARRIGVDFGEGCRLINVSFGSEPWLVKLGNHVSATQVSFVTHDGGVWVFRDQFPDIDVIAPIVVGNNVFIGNLSIILPGVTIGDNVVIGAGSIVTRDIPANCVAAGVPARPIRSLAEYQARVLAKSQPTKRLTLPEKREYYTRIYGLRDRDSQR